MNKRIAKKIIKNEGVLKYSQKQINKAKTTIKKKDHVKGDK